MIGFEMIPRDVFVDDVARLAAGRKLDTHGARLGVHASTAMASVWHTERVEARDDFAAERVVAHAADRAASAPSARAWQAKFAGAPPKCLPLGSKSQSTSPRPTI